MEVDYLLIGHTGHIKKKSASQCKIRNACRRKSRLSKGILFFLLVDGLLINKRKRSVRSLEIDVSNVVIPDGIKTIEAWAFFYRKLKSVTFPNTLQSIGAAAFSNCYLN